jgi:hypothetical protein
MDTHLSHMTTVHALFQEKKKSILIFYNILHLDGGGWEFFSSPPRPERLWGQPSLQSNGCLGVKRPGRKADHSPPPSAGFKNAWKYISTPPVRPHGVVLS